MRTWSRSAVWFVCGRCAQILPMGSPVLRIVVAAGARVKLRCATCADEPVPTDLPAVVVPEEPEPAPVPVRAFAGLPLDWSQRALGEREPGEDDE